MKALFKSLVVGAVVACGLVGSVTASAASVTLEATIEKDPRLQGPGELTVLVRNTSGRSLTLPATPDWNAAGGLRIVVTSPGGRSSTLPVDVDPPEAPGFVLLAGTALGVSRVLDAEAFATPGTYTVVVTYTGAVGVVAQSAPLKVVVAGN
jgi:hypothetical protein